MSIPFGISEENRQDQADSCDSTTVACRLWGTVSVGASTAVDVAIGSYEGYLCTNPYKGLLAFMVKASPVWSSVSWVAVRHQLLVWMLGPHLLLVWQVLSRPL